MNNFSFAAPAPKTPAPWLNTLAEVHAKYFFDTTTNLSYEEIRDDVISNNTHLPLRELAAVLGVVEKQYKEMLAKRAH